MTVTASKILLGVSLAALTYASWGHLSGASVAKPEPSKAKELTAAMVNRSVVLNLVRDPFESHALAGVGGGGPMQPLAVEPGKELADLTLQGVLISPTGRMAMINGRMLREGDVMESAPGKAKLRAKRVGIDYAVVEGGGRVHMLHVEEPVLSAANDENSSKPAQPQRSGVASARD